MIGMKTSSLSHRQKQQQTENISTHLELKENYKGELGHSEKGEEEGEENQQTSEKYCQMFAVLSVSPESKESEI